MKRKSTFKRKEIPWIDLNFEKQIIDSKAVSKCLQCNEILKNTSYDRLVGHR